MRRLRVRGIFLIEALVALAILAIVLMLGAGFLAKRRTLERERVDRERAVRALASEWLYLRTSFRNDLYPKDRRPFVGPGSFVDALDARDAFLRVQSTDVDGLSLVRLEIAYGEKMRKRIVQEGYVFRGASARP